MLPNPIILELYEIFSTWIEVAVSEDSHSSPSVSKLKTAWSITSALLCVFMCDAQFVTEKS
jgi:hypothetical protein